jgi:hypothetical protein
MRKLTCLSLIFCVAGLVSAGCSRAKPVGVTAHQAKLEFSEAEKRNMGRPPITQPTEENVRKTGTNEWTKGPQTQPQPKALEKDFTVRGKVSSAGAGSLTVDLDAGGQKSFQTDENTQVFRSGDSRFFAIEGGVANLGQGTVVSVLAYNKNGQDFARCVSVGEGGFVVPGEPNKKK